MDNIAVPLGARRHVREKFMNVIHPKKSKRFIGLSVMIFSGAMAVFLLMMIIPPHTNTVLIDRDQAATSNTILSQASMINPYEIQNFVCEKNCQHLIVTGAPSNLFADPTCPACYEILLWANFTGEKDTITLSGEAEIDGHFVNLSEQRLPLSEYPDWVGRTFTFNIDEIGTVLHVVLQQTDEWNLISDVRCLSGCENMKVGVQRDINVLLIDTCSPKVCEIFSIASEPTGVNDISNDNLPSDGVWTEDSNDNWRSGGYRVSIWQLSSLFAFNDDHGKEIAGTRTDYSHEQVISEEPLHFDQEFNGRRFTFDLMSTWIEDDSDAFGSSEEKGELLDCGNNGN